MLICVPQKNSRAKEAREFKTPTILQRLRGTHHISTRHSHVCTHTATDWSLVIHNVGTVRHDADDSNQDRNQSQLNCFYQLINADRLLK